MSAGARIRTVRPSVALTFDDGPLRGATPMVLDELDRAGARATFFITPGTEAELLGRMVAAGHEVAYHCGSHVRHSARSRAKVAAEARVDLGWLACHGIRPRSWRTPWGDLASWSWDLAAGLGLELWGWSDDTEDWSGRSSGEMLTDLTRSVGPGSIILMHDGIGPGATRRDCGATIELISPLVQLCRAQGLEVEPIHPGDPG